MDLDALRKRHKEKTDFIALLTWEKGVIEDRGSSYYLRFLRSKLSVLRAHNLWG